MTTNREAETTEKYSLRFWRQRLRSRCHRAGPQRPWETLPQALPAAGDSGVLGVPWLADASTHLCLRRHTASSLYVKLGPNSPYMGTSIIRLNATQFHYDLFVNSRPCFQIRSQSEVPSGHEFGGGGEAPVKPVEAQNHVGRT